MQSTHLQSECIEAHVQATVLSGKCSRLGVLLCEAVSQGCHKKRASPSLEDLDDAASSLGTPRLRAAVPPAPPTMVKRRRMTLAAAQECEIRKMLKMAENSSVFVIETTTPSLILTMNSDQLNCKRELGLAILIMVSNTFNMSTHALVLAISIFDRFLAKTVTVVPSLVKVPLAMTQHCLDMTTQDIEIPLACFIMASKFVETDTPRLKDVVAAAGNRCAVHHLREAEIQILACLHWDIHSLTGEILPPPFSLPLYNASFLSARTVLLSTRSSVTALLENKQRPVLCCC